MRNKLEKIWREKKNMCYIIILAGIILISSVLSYLVENVSRDYAHDKAAQMENELNTQKSIEETEEQRVTDIEKTPEDQSDVSFPIGADQDAAAGSETSLDEDVLKETYDKNLEAFRESFDTEINGSADDISAFLTDSDREEAFRQTIADDIFSTFGNVSVDFVAVKELLSEDEREITCRIAICLGETELPYICSYNKKLNFYSLYSPKELQ